MSKNMIMNLVDSDFFPFDISKKEILYVAIFILGVVLLIILFGNKIIERFTNLNNYNDCKVKNFIKKYNLDSMDEKEAIDKLEEILNKNIGMSWFLSQEMEIAKLLLDKNYKKINSNSK